jgi:hypothetical protein
MYLRKYFWLNYLYFMALFCLLIIGVLINTIGLRWGLPQASRYDMVLSPAKQNEDNYRKMIEPMSGKDLSFGNERMLPSDSQRVFHDAQSPQDSVSPVINTAASDHERLSRIEYMLLVGAFQPDIYRIARSFLQVNVRFFDFFPDTFRYGIMYVVLSNVFLNVLALFDLVMMGDELLVYIKDITLWSQIYFALRLINLFYTFLTAVVVFKLSRIFVNLQLSFLNAIIFLLIPTTLISNYVIGPHALSALFCLLLLYFCIRIVNGHERTSLMVACSFFAALAIGSSYLNILYAGLIWVTFFVLLLRHNLFLFSPKSFSLFCRLFLPLGFFILILCMYALRYTESFVHELRFYSEFIKTQTMSTFFWNSLDFFAQLAQYLGWPLCIIGAFGLLMLNRIWPLTIALGIIAITLSFFQQPEVGAFSFLTIMPVFIIGSSYVFESLLRSHFLKTTVLLICIICVVPLPRSMSEAKHFFYDGSEDSTRLRAGHWINTTIEKGSSIGIVHPSISFYSLPFRIADYQVIYAEAPSPDAKMMAVRFNEYIIAIGKKTADLILERIPNYGAVALFKNDVALNESAFFKTRFYEHANPVITIYKKNLPSE